MWVLRIVGGIYLLSALWCLLNVGVSSASLGFDLLNSAAHVEYFTVYGGLQFGLGLAMLLASFKSDLLVGAVFFSLVFSVVLFAFRLVGLGLYGHNELMLVLLLLEGVIALAFVWQWRTLQAN